MNKIAIFAESFDGAVAPYTAELVAAAHTLAPESEITVFAAGPASLAEQLMWDGVDVLLAQTELSPLQEDAMSALLAAMLEQLNPDWVLVPATQFSRALFARAAAALGVGMTGDCTSLAVENGVFVQHKPAFGSSVMVSCMETDSPAVVTVTPGIYAPAPAGRSKSVQTFACPALPASQIEVLDTESTPQVDSIAAAPLLFSLGRGVMEPQTLAQAKELAQRLGAAVGGTRPLVDSGDLPFEQQIGQTGCTVHPHVCLMMGVSGAIQHTEGIRDAKLVIAVNTDPKAAVFGFADYGAVMDARELLPTLLEQAAR